MKENGKTGLRPLRLVGNFLFMPQSPVFTRSISAEGRTEATPVDLFSGFMVSLLISVSEPMSGY